MAQYVIRPVDMVEIGKNLPDVVVQQLKPYEPLVTEEVRHYVFSEGIGEAVVTLANGTKYTIRMPSEIGFVVQKVYTKDPDETDKVLQEWGRYSDCAQLGSRDMTLVNWLIDFNLYARTDQGVSTSDFKIMQRLRAFDPRRSEKFFGKISLFKCHKDRDDDRRTAMKPARAISCMFPELPHKALIQIGDAYFKNFAPRNLTLHASKDADKFILAYAGDQSLSENIDHTTNRKSLANSCMRHSFGELSEHPASVYASGDFTIIYTLDEEGLVASRCVVYDYPDGKPQAGPIYGVSEQALDMIQDYLVSICAETSDPSWEGARLIRKEEDGGFLGPYLDLHPQAVTDKGNFLQVCNCGEIDASQYKGILGAPYTSCSDCDCDLDEDDVFYSEWHDRVYCDHCYAAEHSWCEYAEMEVPTSDLIRCWRIRASGLKESVYVYDDHVNAGHDFVRCSDGEFWAIEDTNWCEYEAEHISPDSMGDYFLSDWDGDIYPISDLCKLEDGDTVSKYEIDNDPGIWQKNDQDVWSQVQEELELDA